MERTRQAGPRGWMDGAGWGGESEAAISLLPSRRICFSSFRILHCCPVSPSPSSRRCRGASATYLSPRSDRTVLCLATRRSDATHARRSLEAGAPSLVRRSGNPSVSFEFSQ